MSEKVSAIIVAAGSSSRTGGIKKQYMELEGIPVLVRSIEKFSNLEQVKEIIVITGESDIQYVENLCRKYDFSKVKKIVPGGATRQQSVFNGVSHCCKNCGLIAIHDAARPFVKTSDILRVFEQAEKHGAAILGAPVKDTIKKVKNNIIVETPDRSTLFHAQTPQVFKAGLYHSLVQNSEGLDYTDDCQLAEAAGVNVAMVIGSHDNIKITTPEDIIIARYLAKEEKQ